MHSSDRPCSARRRFAQIRRESGRHVLPHQPRQDPHNDRFGKWHLVAWLLLLCVLGFQARAQNHGFRSYAKADGWQGLSVSTLYEDHDGVAVSRTCCAKAGRCRRTRIELEPEQETDPIT